MAPAKPHRWWDSKAPWVPLLLQVTGSSWFCGLGNSVHRCWGQVKWLWAVPVDRAAALYHTPFHLCWRSQMCGMGFDGRCLHSSWRSHVTSGSESLCGRTAPCPDGLPEQGLNPHFPAPRSTQNLEGQGVPLGQIRTQVAQCSVMFREAIQNTRKHSSFI